VTNNTCPPRESVGDYFQAHPQADVDVSDTIVWASRGTIFATGRRSFRLRHQIWIRFPVLTCAVSSGGGGGGFGTLLRHQVA